MDLGRSGATTTTLESFTTHQSHTQFVFSYVSSHLCSHLCALTCALFHVCACPTMCLLTKVHVHALECRCSLVHFLFCNMLHCLECFSEIIVSEHFGTISNIGGVPQEKQTKKGPPCGGLSSGRSPTCRATWMSLGVCHVF